MGSEQENSADRRRFNGIATIKLLTDDSRRTKPTPCKPCEESGRSERQPRLRAKRPLLIYIDDGRTIDIDSSCSNSILPVSCRANLRGPQRYTPPPWVTAVVSTTQRQCPFLSGLL